MTHGKGAQRQPAKLRQRTIVSRGRHVLSRLTLRRRKVTGRTLMRHAIIIILIAIFSFPIYLAVVAASHDARSLLGAVPLLPGAHLVRNMVETLTGAGFVNMTPVSLMLGNSLIMAIGITVGKLAVSIPAAFAVVFFRFPGRMLAFWAIFITLLLPVEVRFFPTYEITADLGMLDSFTGLILPLIASATATFLFRQFFLTLPPALADAARIDGAGPMTFLWKIILPLSRPNLAAIAVIEFIYGWNQYLWPLLAASDGKHQTIVVGMAALINAANEFSVPQWNLVMAAAILALLPPVILMLAMQRWFIEGITAGMN